MKNEMELGEVSESGAVVGHVTEVDSGATTGGDGGGQPQVDVIVAQMVEVTEVVDETEVPPTELGHFGQLSEEQATAPPSMPNPTLVCLICCTSFLQSTAFSGKKKFTASYCGKVWKIFCRLLSPQLAPPAQEFSFEKYPLPFCTRCAKNVIGLSKMQEELELLQSTINFGMRDIREKIKSTDITEITLMKPDLEEYTDKIEDIRSYALRELESKSKQTGEREEDFEEIPVSPEGGSLDVDLYQLEAASSKRFWKPRPLANSVPVKLESLASQIQVSEGFTVLIEDDNETEKGEKYTPEIPEVGSSSPNETSGVGYTKSEERDPKVEALAKKLSSRTRKDILQKRRKELKRNAREKAVHPYGHVIEMKDGRLLFGNVIISQTEVNGVNKYKCDYCGARLKSMGLMRRHIRQAHKNGSKNEYHCKICGKELTNIGSLPRHMMVFHSNKVNSHFPCDVCGKILRSARTLECHKALVHSVGMENYHICDICGRPFRSMRNMKQHRLTHMSIEESTEFKQNEETREASVRIFDCEYCGKRLSCGASYRQHMMIHEEVLPFTCDVCGWGFRHKCNLQAHLELHQGDERARKFKCDFPECGRSYSTKTQLSAHSFSHRPPEDKPFKCLHPGCSMGFTRAYDLSIHRRTHTGERPYKCVMCPKAFSRSHHLSRHFNKVHNPNNVETTELITAEIVEPTSNMTIEFVITGAEGETFTLPDLKL